MSEEIVSLLDLLEKEKRYADMINTYSHRIDNSSCNLDLIAEYIAKKSVVQEELNNVYVGIKEWLDKLN